MKQLKHVFDVKYSLNNTLFHSVKILLMSKQQKLLSMQINHFIPKTSRHVLR